MRTLRSVAELYAHAIAMEQEAAARYAELAERMDDEGREDLARLFDGLARAEAEHLDVLRRRTDGVVLPSIDAGAYSWLGTAAPETAARELVFRMMTPRTALAIALQAESRAQVFFERVSLTADDPAMRLLAGEMADEERRHGQLITALLESTPSPSLDGTVLFAE